MLQSGARRLVPVVVVRAVTSVRKMGSLATVEKIRENARELADEPRIHCGAKSYTYNDLIDRSTELAEAVGRALSNSAARDEDQVRLAYSLPPTFPYLSAQYCAWMNKAIAVPLHPDHPRREIEYIVQDSAPAAIICTAKTKHLLVEIAKQRSTPLLTISESDASVLEVENESTQHASPIAEEGEAAMLIYTSGTTGKPKGVVWTHEMLQFQYHTLSREWGWQRDDRIINFLPLHHVHGLNNIIGCALWNGAVLDMMEKFNPEMVWDMLCSDSAPTVFMAVPTIYARMIASFEQNPTDARREAASKLRLFVSGSAALQNTYFRRWQEITGQRILERYGMSEVGMALSNEYLGERREGWVGKLFPGLHAKVEDPETKTTAAVAGTAVGELLLSGPGVFEKYWRREQATTESFDSEGFFRTGDVVERDDEGWYRILGRRSTDIIKSGGYKLSALEIEREMLEHPDIAQVAVVGLEDEEFGQVVAAMVVLKEASPDHDTKDLRTWCKTRLAAYKVPRIVRITDSIPRNAMGKIEKKKVIALF